MPVSANLLLTAAGLIRDVLSAQIPNILRKRELYAAASIPGAVFVVPKSLQVAPHAIAAACMLTALAIRLAAIRWHLTLPNGSSARSVWRGDRDRASSANPRTGICASTSPGAKTRCLKPERAYCASRRAGEISAYLHVRAHARNSDGLTL